MSKFRFGKIPFKEIILFVLISIVLSVDTNLIAAILPDWFTKNSNYVIGASIIVILLISLAYLPAVIKMIKRGGNCDTEQIPGDDFFCGREKEKQKIIDLLANQKFPLLVLFGIGGVGKTSLIRKVEKAENIFDKIIWQSAKNEFIESDYFFNRELLEFANFENLCKRIAGYFQELIEYNALKTNPQKLEFVRDLLKKNKTLLIIDNLETYQEKDTDNLVKNLRELLEGTSSKAVFTSRFELENVKSYELRGLSLEETGELLNHEFSLETETPILLDKYIKQIFEATQGLPLAIKLIAARLKKSDTSALETILIRLSDVDFNNQDEIYEKFYKFIYYEIWNKNLSEDAKLLLIDALIYSIENLIFYDGLQAIFFRNKDNLSNFEIDRFYQAFRELKKNSLLESRPSDHNTGYFMHPLTKNFIKAELMPKNKR